MPAVSSSSRSSVRSLIASLLRIAGPVALARLGIMGMGVTDTIVVGQLAPKELPFLALGWAPTGVLLLTGIGLLAGVQMLTARAVGEGNPKAAGAVWRRGIVIAVAAGAIFGVGLWLGTEPLLIGCGIAPDLARGATDVSRVLALSLPLQFAYMACSFFLEAIRRPGAATVVIWVANALNLAVNLALVPHLGAQGSAWATVAARSFMLLSLIVWILLSPSSRAHGVSERSSGAPSYRTLLGVGVAAAMSQIAEAGAFYALTVIAGRIGAQAVAAYQILLNLLAVVFMMALGLSAATAVTVSHAYGRRDLHATARAGWIGLGLNAALMGITAAALLFGAPLIARAFTADEELVKLLVALIPLTALVPLPDGSQVLLASALRARGDNWFPTASHVVAYVLVMPPAGYILAERCGLGAAGLMQAIVAASILSVGVLLARWWNLAGGLASFSFFSRR